MATCSIGLKHYFSGYAQRCLDAAKLPVNEYLGAGSFDVNSMAGDWFETIIVTDFSAGARTGSKLASEGPGDAARYHEVAKNAKTQHVETASGAYQFGLAECFNGSSLDVMGSGWYGNLVKVETSFLLYCWSVCKVEIG